MQNFWLRLTSRLAGEIMTGVAVLLLIWVNAVETIETAAHRQYIAWQIHYAWSNPEKAVFGRNGCGDPCIVRYSDGGLIMAFVNMASVIRSAGRSLIVDGPCASACAIMADKARPNVCVTTRAVFLFHMGFMMNGRRVAPTTSFDIREWVYKHGGFPYDGFLTMDAQEATEFWPVCKAG